MIVLDIETTGQVPYEHSILSIGAVDFSNPSNQFYGECRIRNGAKIDPVALRINGFREDELTSEKKRPQKELLQEFIDWSGRVNDATLAGLNHYMDIYFLKFSLKHYGLDDPLNHRIVDLHTLVFTHILIRGLEPPLSKKRTGFKEIDYLRSSSLDTAGVYEYCGIPNEEYPHNALTGARMETEAFSRIIYGESVLREFERYPMPEYLNRNAHNLPSKMRSKL